MPTAAGEPFRDQFYPQCFKRKTVLYKLQSAFKAAEMRIFTCTGSGRQPGTMFTFNTLSEYTDS
jgi:hypothetical protein